MTEFLELVDLAARRVGGAVLAANDEFFAPKERLLLPTRPIFVDGRYTERGKWMDGWETRRRRTPGHDWCVIRLGIPGTVHGVSIDTTHFAGNFPEHASIDGVAVEGPVDVASLTKDSSLWFELVPRTLLRGNTENLIAVPESPRVTHIRLNIYPDGGVARLRVYGRGLSDWQALSRVEAIDVASAAHGGLVVASSDMFFGSRQNLILPGVGRTIGEGWETKRRRTDGHDWAIVQLAASALIERVEVDTTHYVGNAPGSCSVDTTIGTTTAEITAPDHVWESLLPPIPLWPDSVHRFEHELRRVKPATHARLNIFPDGGVNRLRLFGRVSH
ncbi:MAG: allantoicase [Acidobacteria bacterium]|nr:allantoicase [Acidobacteriota bacterium]